MLHVQVYLIHKKQLTRKNILCFYIESVKSFRKPPSVNKCQIYSLTKLYYIFRLTLLDDRPKLYVCKFQVKSAKSVDFNGNLWISCTKSADSVDFKSEIKIWVEICIFY